MAKFILFAPNVGVGGGLVLLNAIVRDWPSNIPLIAILDERSRSRIGTVNAPIDIHWYRSSVRGRVDAERALHNFATSDDTVFCFHNLPPILPNSARVICYVHNPNLVGLVPIGNLSGWVKMRIALERIILLTFRKRISFYIVQTETMALALSQYVGVDVREVHVLPFIDDCALPKALHNGPEADQVPTPDFDFIYPSDGTAHKNHRTLVQAWQLLANAGLYPTVALTLHAERDAALRREIGEAVARTGIKMIDLGQLPHADALSLYGRAGALIFPSYAESFGIPLVEASAAGLPILAAEMDFVRDVCEPTTTFDPHSPRSIARAVRRFLEGSGSAGTLLSSREFIERALTENRPG